MKAVLVFCEGRHDIVFAQRSLGTHGDIVENVATDTMFFLVRSHGQDQSDTILKLLQVLETTMTLPTGTFEVSEYAAAFMFDANGEGVNTTLAGFCDRYGTHFGDLGSLEHGKWLAENTVPVGCFVFHKANEDPTGTIEDHLAPMVKMAWPERYAEAEGFVDDNKDATDKVSDKEAERLKAIITVTGQFDHPGDPMSIIIGRGGLPRAQFEGSELSAQLAAFLVATPWSNEGASIGA